VKTTRERAEEKRVEKLQMIDEQVASGRLIVRKMTEEERVKYPPRPEGAPQKRRRF